MGKIRLLSRTASLSNGPFQPLYPMLAVRERDRERTSFKEFPILSFSVASSTLVPVREMGYRNEWYSVYSQAKLRCSASAVAPGAAPRADVASRHWTRSKMGLRRNWKVEFSLYPLSARGTPRALSLLFFPPLYIDIRPFFHTISQ